LHQRDRHCSVGSITATSGTALASWNEGAAKQAIFDFVRTTTNRGSANFVLPEDRIAVFDQDGTLWVEHPIYSQVAYCHLAWGSDADRRRGHWSRVSKIKTLAREVRLIEGSKFDQHSQSISPERASAPRQFTKLLLSRSFDETPRGAHALS
jgi:hypothetical protein